MFAGLLNKGFRGSLPLIISVFTICAVFSWFTLVPLEQEYYPNLFYNFFTRNIESKLAITLLNYLFIGLGVLLVGIITANQEIVDKQNHFPVFLYLILCITGANPFQITSQIFTNVILLYSLFKLLDTYRREDVLRLVFGASFWLSVSAFVTISSIISFPLFFVGLLILRPFHWREWVIALLGLFMPIFIYECMAYLSNFNQWYLADATELFFHSLKIPSFSEYYIPLSLALFILLIISVLYNVVNGFGNTVKKQKSKAILLWMLFFGTFGFFSGGADSSSILLTFSIPLSFFIGDLLFSLKQKKIANTLLAVLIIGALIVYLGHFQVI